MREENSIKKIGKPLYFPNFDTLTGGIEAFPCKMYMQTLNECPRNNAQQFFINKLEEKNFT